MQTVYFNFYYTLKTSLKVFSDLFSLKDKIASMYLKKSTLKI